MVDSLSGRSVWPIRQDGWLLEEDNCGSSAVVGTDWSQWYLSIALLNRGHYENGLPVLYERRRPLISPLDLAILESVQGDESLSRFSSF